MSILRQPRSIRKGLIVSKRNLIALAAVAATLAAAGPGNAAPGATTYFYQGAFVVRPTQTIDVSGTGSWLIGKLHWRTWTPASAVGTGVLYTNECKPSCAAGHFSREPASVRFYGNARCHGKDVFTRARITARSLGEPMVSDFRSLGFLSDC